MDDPIRSLNDEAREEGGEDGGTRIASVVGHCAHTTRRAVMPSGKASHTASAARLSIPFATVTAQSTQKND
eukprot:scaffold83722_cov25-Tisochrysis_lutea.AAC.1